jgi:CMP-2-keto-3-deoxyoctulosonic acid synthetase
MLGIDDEQIIVNVQGDEPMLGEQVIKQVANNLANSKMQMATLCENVLDNAQYLDPNCVKDAIVICGYNHSSCAAFFGIFISVLNEWFAVNIS